MKYLLLPAALLLVACHSDTPATATSLRSADADRFSAYDTLHVAGDGVLHLKPITEAAFRRVPEDTTYKADYEATLAADTGRVRRQGTDLILRPAQGPAVTLRNKQEKVEMPDGQGSYNLATATYYYRGPLPGTHQWLVDINELYPAHFGSHERYHTYYCLIDQRTGRQTKLVSFPVVSPDGRYLLCAASGLYEDLGLEGPAGLQFVQLGPGAPRPCWLRNPRHWGPDAPRWAGPRTVVLEQARLLPNGHDAPSTYVELTLP
ncbi:MAG: hypothetical protein ACRYFX_07065 [Janthinobacterium lividum]